MMALAGGGVLLLGSTNVARALEQPHTIHPIEVIEQLATEDETAPQEQ